MRHARPIAAFALLALAGTAGGCRVGCEDVKSIRVVTESGFTVTLTGASPVPALLAGDVHYTQRQVRDFQRLHAVLAEEARDSRNMVLTLHGYEMPAAGRDQITLTLSIPSGARAGDRYRVIRAFTPPAIWAPEEWTFRAPVAPGEVEIGFMRSRPQIPNPPYNYAAVYTATTASGTVEVLARGGGVLALGLDVAVADASGQGYRLLGRATATAVNEGERCFSPA